MFDGQRSRRRHAFGKHLYGGVGNNPFNPAMLGFALVLVCFPQQFIHWPVLSSQPGRWSATDYLNRNGRTGHLDAATALDSLRINKSLTMDELFARISLWPFRRQRR